ncbi:hypothetical protein HP1_70 [Citrobacter phage vB_CbrM_HP1]|uniref:Uncharacterized protein n=1 Tax=Citrobacter phage vB_CbrM_HP1 TaxID=2876111 RepID=A0AAE8Z1D9_9CAUD|nr:hypothetical protein HP1_70 [Citrobacter phage vB_CbrM_HP1]
MKTKQTIVDMMLTTLKFERHFVDKPEDIPKCTVHIIKKREAVSGNINYMISNGGLIK